MTELNKPISRRTLETVRDRGRIRQLVVTLYPNGLIGIRPAGTRQEETTTIESVWSLATKQRVARERVEKKAKRKSKNGV